MSLPPPNERQARLIWLALTGLAVAVLVGLCVGLIWGLGQVLRILSPVLWPLAVGGVIAYLLDPVVDFLQGRGLSRVWSIVSVFAVAVLLIAVLCASVVPQLVRETRQLAQRVPTYAARLQTRTQDWINNPPPVLRRFLEKDEAPPDPRSSATNLVPPAVPLGLTNSAGSFETNSASLLNAPLARENFETAAGWLAAGLKQAGAWLFGRVAGWFGVLAGLALVPVYAFYFLLEKRGISSRWTDYLPVADSGFKSEMVFVLNSINNYLIAFFRGQVLVAICDGILYGIGFLIIGLPYALLIGAFAMVLTMIPFLGAFVTCSAGLIIAVVQFGDWRHPLWVLAVFGLVQMLEGLVISPRIMGNRVGLHPLTIIIAVMAGTTLLGGLLGGILAIPLTAALRVLMFRYVWKRES